MTNRRDQGSERVCVFVCFGMRTSFRSLPKCTNLVAREEREGKRVVREDGSGGWQRDAETKGSVILDPFIGDRWSGTEME